MSNTAQTAHLPSVLFLGMQGRFSYPPLRALLEAGIQVCAVVIPAEQVFEAELPAIQKLEQLLLSRTMLPVLNSSIHSSILELARERNIPVWKVRQLSNSETIRVFTAYQPDMICVACFSKRIPRDILDIPRLGCLNVHPSLLPANRGPEPLFWSFREGNEQTGVTIHLMDEGIGYRCNCGTGSHGNSRRHQLLGFRGTKRGTRWNTFGPECLGYVQSRSCTSKAR